MLKKINHHHLVFGFIGIMLSISGFVISSMSNLNVFSSIMLSIWCVYLMIFSILHAYKGFETSAYFMVFGFSALLIMTLGLYLFTEFNLRSIQNILVVPFVILHTTGTIRKWVNKIKDSVGIIDQSEPSFDEQLFDDVHFPQQYLVYPYIQQMSNSLMFPQHHIKNIDSDKQKTED